MPSKQPYTLHTAFPHNSLEFDYCETSKGLHQIIVCRVESSLGAMLLWLYW